MSTIQDLNTAITITYNDEASYAIVFGANAGNTTANVGPLGTANITQQTTLTSITSPVRDLLIDVQFSNVGVVDMNYVGTYSNIGILQIAPAAWRVSGIRSTAQYTEAMANVKYTDLTGIVYDVAPNYSYVTTVNDQSGNTRTWNTTVDVNAYVNNMINRTYTTNTITQLFSTSTPSLDDEPDVGQTYTITLNSSLGKFGNSDAYFSSNTFANLANTYTFTGNTSTVNANYSNIRFAPTNRVSGNGTFTYTQSRSGNTQVSLVKTLTANVQPLASANTYTFTANSTFTPTFDQAQYGIANILVVGGGGSAQYGNTLVGAVGGTASWIGGGAGGGGEVQWYKTTPIDVTTYTVTVGTGGAENGNNSPGPLRIGNAGGNSSVTSSSNINISAAGGLPGVWDVYEVLTPGGSSYTPRRWALEADHGGYGGGNITVGNITGGYGGGNTTSGAPFSWFAGNGVYSGTANIGSQGGGGGSKGYVGLGTTIGGNGAVGVTHALTGSAVLGGGGATRPITYGSDGVPGGNSYGLGGSTISSVGNQNGADGVVIINIS
jgi:hypothetical protein